MTQPSISLLGTTALASAFEVVVYPATPGTNYGSLSLDGVFFPITGYDFTPYVDSDNVVASTGTPISSGAWVRMLSSNISNRETFISTSGVKTDKKFRDLQDKVNDIISVRDNGATGNNTLNDKTDINELSLNMTWGKDLLVPPGQYKFVQGGLVQTRLHSWNFEPGALFRGDYVTGQFDDLFVMGITEAQANGEKEVRGGRLMGGKFLTYRTDNPGLPDFYNPVTGLDVGGYAVTLSAVAPNINIIGFRIVQASILGGKGAIRLIGDNVNKTIAWSIIDACSLTNGVVCEKTADGLKFRDNICSGVNPSYKWDLIPGSFCYTIDGGTSSSREGLLDIQNAEVWRVNNVQIEHSSTFAASSPAYSSLRVRGVTDPSIAGYVLLSNFGGGTTRVQNSIVLENAINTVIDENYFNITATSDLRIESIAHCTIVGSRNMARGSRNRRAVGSYTDASRLLTINMVKDASSNVAQGCRGIWYKAADILVNLQNTWAINNLEIMLCENGMVAFNGGFTGGNLSGEICLIPIWLWPHQDAYVVCVETSTGAVRSLKIAAATGVLSIIGTLSNSSINFANTTYPAVTNVPYNSGP